MGESLKNKAAKSVMWSAVERFSVQGIQFILTIIIARLVSPSDYGLIAMLGIFLAIAQTFIDSGFSNALIQKQDRTETDFSTVFYFNIVVGVVVYILLYLCSPFIAGFYNEPKLDLITKVVGLNLIISSFSVVQRAKLTIALNFKLQAVISLIAVVISGTIGVYLAYTGYGVWAIVFQFLLNNLLNTLLLWIFAKWCPKQSFAVSSFKQLFSFGSKLLFSDLLNVIYVNLYTLVIGKKFSATNLGYYNRAYTLTYFPSGNIGQIITRAMYPLQCSIQDNEILLRDSFIKYIRITCFFIFPLMILLCLLAKPIVILFLTEKWLPAVPLIQILAIAYMWDPIMRINENILKVKGRSDYILKSEIIKKILAVVILLLTLPFGIKAICIGSIIYSLTDMSIISIYVKKCINISLVNELFELRYIILTNISLCIFVYILTLFISNPYILVFGISIIGILYYLLISKVLKLKEFSAFIELINNISK